MAKFKDVQTDIERLFGGLDDSPWLTYGITSYPVNYQGGTYASEFVIVEIIPGRPLTTYGSQGVQGQVIVQIYTQAGNGISRAVEIADLLDALLQGKQLPRGTITGTSSMSVRGIDSQDNSLFRADYVVPFRRY